jgi:hypothetical protein
MDYATPSDGHPNMMLRVASVKQDATWRSSEACADVHTHIGSSVQ